MQRAPLALSAPCDDPYAVQLITRDLANPHRCLSNAFRVSPPTAKRTSAEHCSAYELEDDTLPPEPGQQLSIAGTKWKSVQHYLLAARFFHRLTDAHLDLLTLIEAASSAEAACAIARHVLQPEVPSIRNSLVPEAADALCGKVSVRADWSLCAEMHLDRALEVKFDTKTNLRLCRRLVETCPGDVHSTIVSDRAWARIPEIDAPPSPASSPTASFEALLLRHRERVARLLRVSFDPEPEIAIQAPEPDDTSTSIRRCLSISFIVPNGLTIGGVEWKSLEHWLVASRFLDPVQVRDPAHVTLVACIHEAKTPELARAIALFATFRRPPACRPAAISPLVASLRGKVYVRPDWGRVRTFLLVQGLQAKFADKKQARMAKRLLDTGLAGFTCEERSRDAKWHDTWEQAATPPATGPSSPPPSSAAPPPPPSMPELLTQMRARLRNPRMNADDGKHSPWTYKPSGAMYWTEAVQQALRQKASHRDAAAPSQPRKRLRRPAAATATSSDDDEDAPKDATPVRKRQKAAATAAATTTSVPFRIWTPKSVEDGIGVPQKTQLRMSHIRLPTVTTGAELQRAFPPGTYRPTPARDSSLSISVDASDADTEACARTALKELWHRDAGGLVLGAVVEFPQWKLHFGLIRRGVWCRLSKWLLESEPDDDDNCEDAGMSQTK
jgi:predicted NAD-dependent protein-ADP-ribosyltransferase YbiA (DUF1768 family)